MNPLEIYMRAIRPFNQPYFAMIEAYAGFLRHLPQWITTAPANAAMPSPETVLTRRAMAAAAPRDATKKELPAIIRPSSPERSGKTPAVTQSAAVERAKRAWATRRANAAAEERAARKAARAKARARKTR
jgi:rubrerythrin